MSGPQAGIQECALSGEEGWKFGVLTPCCSAHTLDCCGLAGPSPGQWNDLTWKAGGLEATGIYLVAIGASAGKEGRDTWTFGRELRRPARAPVHHPWVGTQRFLGRGVRQLEKPWVQL